MSVSVLDYYKTFVRGKNPHPYHYDNLKVLLSRFSQDTFEFVGTWNQVATSRSTSLFFTGTSLKNVQAEYTLDESDNKNIIVKNTTSTTNPVGPNITGISEPVDPAIPTCRTVAFPYRPGPPGNYWIIYISKDGLTLIVGSPLIVENCLVHANFALYILTKKSRDDFWSTQGKAGRCEIKSVCQKYGYTKCWNEPVRTD